MTNSRACALVPLVIRFLRSPVALLLLALWLPATQHCVFGAALDWEVERSGTTCHHDESGTHEDVCTMVEGGDYLAGATLAHVPAPNLTTLACLACLHAQLLAEAPPLAPPAWAKNSPDEWVPRWAFVARAALPARAPTLT